MSDWPEGLRFAFKGTPSASLRGALAQEIHAFHDRTFPDRRARFALVLQDEAGGLAAGLSGRLSWQWLFVEALWVAEAWRRREIGRRLMARAEAYAILKGCHSAWLDTVQQPRFYTAMGYQIFGVLPDYPPGQSRTFLQKRLIPRST